MHPLVFTPKYRLNRWKAALAAVQKGDRNAKVICVGDSTTVGFGAVAADAAGAEPSSYPAVLSGLIPKGKHESFFGDMNLTISGANAYDTRRSGGTNYTVFTGCPAWSCLQLAAANTNTYTFTTATAVTHAEIYTLQSASSAVYTWRVGAGDTTNAGGTGSNAYFKTTVDLGSSDTKEIIVARGSGGTFWLSGMVCYDNDVKEVSVINWGISSSQVVNHAVTTSPWSPANALATMAPDLTIICLTINDAANSAAVASYTSNMQIVIDKAKTSGDVLLVTGAPTDPATTPIGRQQTYIDVNRELSRRNRIPLINMTKRWASYAAANSASRMRDGTHPNDTGLADKAAAIAGEIL